MDATFNATYGDRRARFYARGELDVGCRDELRRRLSDLIGLGPEEPGLQEPGLRELGLQELSVDVSGVTFIDCSSLRVLHEARRRLESRGGRLEVVAWSSCFGLVSGLAGYDWPTRPVPEPARVPAITSAGAGSRG